VGCYIVVACCGVFCDCNGVFSSLCLCCVGSSLLGGLIICVSG